MQPIYKHTKSLLASQITDKLAICTTVGVNNPRK